VLPARSRVVPSCTAEAGSRSRAAERVAPAASKVAIVGPIAVCSATWSASPSHAAVGKRSGTSRVRTTLCHAPVMAAGPTRAALTALEPPYQTAHGSPAASSVSVGATRDSLGNLAT
jgi:hypothetical protein